MVAHRALAARAARPSMRFERRTNCREATPWESWKRYTGRCSNHRRSRLVFLSTLFYAAIVVVVRIHTHIRTRIHTLVHTHAPFLISTLRRCELPLLSKRAHDRERFWSDFAPYEGSRRVLCMEIDSRKTEALPFLPPENPSFPLPSLSLSFHGRYRLPEVKKACLLQAFCYSTCPRSFRTSSGHVHKSNKCVLSKINVVKFLLLHDNARS